MDPLVAADAEHGDNVFVMQQSRSLGLDLEALAVSRIQGYGRQQNLERDPAAERDLLGFVHDAHGAPADLANQSVFPESGRRQQILDRPPQLRIGKVARDIIHKVKVRKTIGQDPGDRVVARQEFIPARPLAASK
jgi:hypothetical protein